MLIFASDQKIIIIKNTHIHDEQIMENYLDSSQNEANDA